MSNESDVGDIQASADAQAEDQVNGELKDEVNTKGTANAKIHVGEAEADEEDDDAEPDEGECVLPDCPSVCQIDKLKGVQVYRRGNNKT